MNIFKVLSRGNGKVSETNVSAFLGFLLNPNEQHGLGKEFLSRFIEIINDKLKKTNNNDSKILSLLYVNNIISKELVQKFNIEVEIEKKYDSKWIDLELFINHREHKNNNLRIGIELKINDEAIQKDQLQNYYNHLAKKEGNNLLIFLALDSIKSNDIINKITITSLGPKVIFITWEDIVTLITRILDKHNKGDIDSIHQLTIQLLISFKQFILSNFRDDVDPKQMKYIVTIDNEDVIFQNFLSRTILEICKYYKDNHPEEFKKISRLNKKGITINKYFIANEEEYNDHGLNTTRYFNKDDEVMIFDNEKFYLTTELETRHLKAFVSKLKKLNLNIELDINEKEK